MGLLEQVTCGKIKKNFIHTLMGPAGVGKTTLAADYPNAIICQAEEGSNHLNAARFPLISSFKDVISSVDELLSSKHDYKTFVLDSADQAELRLWKDICKENNVREITELPYGKGYALAMASWQELTTKLLLLREKMNIIIICHSQVKTINDPMKSAPYDRHDMKLNAKAAALLKEISDAVFFLAFDVIVTDVKGGKGKAVGDGRRVIYTHGTASHEGKNRYGLPYELPLSYEALMEAIDSGNPEDPKALCSEITALLARLDKSETKTKAEAAFIKAGTDSIALIKIRDRLQALIKD